MLMSWLSLDLFGLLYDCLLSLSVGLGLDRYNVIHRCVQIITTILFCLLHPYRLRLRSYFEAHSRSVLFTYVDCVVQTILLRVCIERND